MRYAAPRYLTIEKATADEASSADTPAAAAATWTSVPVSTPKAETTPARRLSNMLRVAM